MKARLRRLRGWFAYSPQRRLTAAAIVLLLLAAGTLGALQLRSLLPTHLAALSGNPSETATPRPGGGPLPTAARMPAVTALPTATPGPITGIGARLRVYPRFAQPDLTLGSLQAPEAKNTKSLAYTPDPHYTAEDTLTDTGPGPPGPLTGLPTKPAYADRPAVAVVIDNFDPDARPQAGLNRASVVFETIAEGGITRLMAIYLEKDAPIVGPVRSARIYFDAWAAGMHAVYGHAGGNNDALAQIPKIKALADVDGLAPAAANPFPWDLFWRSSDRVAPHNFYTASSYLRDFAQATGRVSAPSFTPSLPHRIPAPALARPAGGWIHIPVLQSLIQRAIQL